MAKEKTEVMNIASEEALAILKDSYPVEQGFKRTFYPRLGFFSQDQTEGKGKGMRVVSEAGTFYVEKQSDQVDEETGKTIWSKEEISSSSRESSLSFTTGLTTRLPQSMTRMTKSYLSGARR